mmetsp:Transcript_26944/g.53940  ORF Transcript_26944/g.53940 Transcript_26944/m.53940 type:complete len:208 (+) Transcript_26944:235-858(+)
MTAAEMLVRRRRELGKLMVLMVLGETMGMLLLFQEKEKFFVVQPKSPMKNQVKTIMHRMKRTRKQIVRRVSSCEKMHLPNRKRRIRTRKNQMIVLKTLVAKTIVMESKRKKILPSSRKIQYLQLNKATLKNLTIQERKAAMVMEKSPQEMMLRPKKWKQPLLLMPLSHTRNHSLSFQFHRSTIRISSDSKIFTARSYNQRPKGTLNV